MAEFINNPLHTVAPTIDVRLRSRFVIAPVMEASIPEPIKTEPNNMALSTSMIVGNIPLIPPVDTSSSSIGIPVASELPPHSDDKAPATDSPSCSCKIKIETKPSNALNASVINVGILSTIKSKVNAGTINVRGVMLKVERNAPKSSDECATSASPYAKPATRNTTSATKKSRDGGEHQVLHMLEQIHTASRRSQNGSVAQR